MKKLIFILVGLFLAGCANKAADLVAPPVKFEKENISGDNITFEFNPKVDIMFALDDSGSMKDKLQKLRSASGLFVENFGENSLVDYRLGVITAYDSNHCDSGNLYKGKQVVCYPQGKLRFPFISRGPESKKLIFEALNIGTHDPENGGPIVEELFSPILTALTPEMNKENDYWIRTDSHKVIVIMTDEDDTSPISIDEFIYEIDQKLGLGNVSIYGIAYTKNCALSKNNANRRPFKIEKTIKRMGGQMFAMCDASYGNSLAKIGSDIRKRSLRQEIRLSSLVEKGTIKLSYGGKEIPYGKGWKYKSATRTIEIDENLDITYDPNARFTVDYTRIEESAIRKKRVFTK